MALHIQLICLTIFQQNVKPDYFAKPTFLSWNKNKNNCLQKILTFKQKRFAMVCNFSFCPLARQLNQSIMVKNERIGMCGHLLERL